MKKTIRLTESDLHRVIRESVKRVINETELNYDVDNFSGRYYKNPPEEIDPTDYLDDPNNPPGSGEDWADWDDFVEDEFGGDQKAAENAYSWGLHDNSGFLPDGNKGRMAYGYDADSMIDRNNDSIDDDERVKTAMGQHEKKKWLNGAKDDEMFDFLHPWFYNESKLRNIVHESIKRVVNEELSDKVKRSMQMASDWIDVDNNNRMLTDFTPDMYSPNYRGNNNVYDLSNDVSPLGHKRHEEMNDAWGEHERNESKIRNIVRESIKKVVNESYLYTKDINTDDLRINGHWTEDGYAEWEATVDNGWYTLRGTYDGHNCELDEIIEGHSGHSVQHSVDDDTIDWFNQNICDRVKSWLDKYAEDYSEWHSKMYGDE